MKKTLLLLLVFAAFFVSCEDEAQEPLTHRNVTITESIVWKPENNPHVIDGYVRVNGGSLTIEPGVIIRFESRAYLDVEGTNSILVAEGTLAKPILFSSTSASPQAGNWRYIRFRNGTINSRLNHCVIEYGGGDTQYAMVHVDGNAQVSVDNCTLRNSQTNPLGAWDLNGNGFVSFTNNAVSSTNTHAIKIAPKHILTIGENNFFDAANNYGILVWSGTSLNRFGFNATIKKQTLPYYFDRGIEVGNNATLTIEPGVDLRFAQDRGIDVGTIGNSSNNDGKLVAIGTEEEPIIFRSASASPQAGNWRGIRFLANTLPGSIIEYCHIKHGGSYSLYQGNITVEPCGSGNPTIRNTHLSESSAYGIFRRKISNQWGDPLMENNTFSDNVLGDVNEID